MITDSDGDGDPRLARPIEIARFGGFALRVRDAPATRRARTVPAVLVSFVLRIRSEDLERGLLTGRIEHVASGTQHAFRDLDDVAAFCHDVTSAQPALPAPLASPDGIGS